MKSNILKSLSLFALSLTYTTTAFAHDHVSGFVSGFTHPIMGLDHLLAMVAVGILSTQIGGRALFIVPISFVLLMLFGSVMGLLGVPLVGVEINIAVSVILLGLAIAFDKKMPLFWSMIFVGFFAIFHGYAHSVEIPELAEPVKYASGFLLATTLLHIVGVIIGEVIRRLPKDKLIMRVLGVATTVTGIYIFYGLLTG